MPTWNAGSAPVQAVAHINKILSVADLAAG